ncbi:MAG: PAS domain S-box protein, partial [Candidatus Fermentibacteria bacterium]|nr:PAS domain S-box protein [Candidatus Fermentibacteria bacterium]
MSFGSSSWTRLTFAPFSGEMLVDGDLFAVLGINRDKLTSAKDPFSLLPASVTKSLIEGTEIFRDEELSLVIIPGKTGSSNTATIIAEQMVDFDLVADMAGGVVGFAPDGTILRWNTRMTHLFGPREKDVKGRNASDVLPCPVLYDWSSVISSAHLGHEVRVEFKPYGEKRVDGILSRGGPGVIGLFSDSTESFKTSKRLRALNRLNQAYLQSTGTGLLLLDSRLRVLLSNSGFPRITGRKGSLIGLQLHDILSEDSYKWVHDASEHLLAEEKREQSGIVTFVNQEGRLVTLRQTLRAVRNETNQALNFVCLFEDETDLTFFRNRVDHLNTNISGLARISREILKTEYGKTGGFCEDILRVTGSKAVARYLYDSSETLILAGSAGNWSQGFPSEELSGYGFPAFVWSGDKQYRVSSVEMGRLSNHYNFCLVLPIGIGVSNQGFLLLAESTLLDSDSDLLDAISSFIQIENDISNERKARSVAEKHLEFTENFAVTALDGISLPIAIVRADGRVDQWNRAMELVSGVAAEEVNVEDITNLIDPEGEGFSLDSRTSSGDHGTKSFSAEWAVRRKDGSKSPVYRWNVSVIENPGGLYRDPSFLISGVSSISSEPLVMDNRANSLQGKLFFERIVDLLLAVSQTDVLRSLSDICFIADGEGILEFSSGN